MPMKNAEKMDFINKCETAIKEFAMLPENSEVIVGVSGGADSVCLLNVLCSLKEKYKLKIRCAHINHGIRGAEAKRDSDFTEKLCEKLGVEFNLLNADCIGEAAISGETVEECGRRIRYDFFNSLCNSENSVIATAHNADDNAETVLFNIARGATIKGAAGIPPVRGKIVRPLIYCTRAEIEAFCAENNLTFVTDSTNLSDDYTRNRIRHNAIPALLSVNEAAIEAFSRFSISAGNDNRYLEHKSKELLEKARIGDNAYSTPIFISEDSVIIKRALYFALERFNTKKAESEKLEGLLKILYNGGKIQLYKGCFAENDGDVFKFYAPSKKDAVPENSVVTLPFNAVFGNYKIICSEYTNNSKKVHHLVLDNLIDCDTINGALKLRGRLEGDKFTSFHRKVTKSLKKLFNELKIPPDERDFIPVIADDDGIVWVYGVGVDANHRPGEFSENIYLVEGDKL